MPLWSTSRWSTAQWSAPPSRLGTLISRVRRSQRRAAPGSISRPASRSGTGRPGPAASPRAGSRGGHRHKLLPLAVREPEDALTVIISLPACPVPVAVFRPRERWILTRAGTAARLTAEGRRPQEASPRNGVPSSADSTPAGIPPDGSGVCRATRNRLSPVHSSRLSQSRPSMSASWTPEAMAWRLYGTRLF